MPYKLQKSGSGYKVCKKLGKKKCFSKKPLSKKKAKAQMYAITANEKFLFSDYYYLNEALRFGENERGRGYMRVRAPIGHDIFSIPSLLSIIRSLKKVNKQKLWEFIKKHSHNFSPLVVIVSLMVAMGQTQDFINKHPEILQKDPDIVEKAAKFLNEHPNILKIFQDGNI